MVRPLALLLLFILSSNVRASVLAQPIKHAYSQSMNDYFLAVRNAAVKFPVAIDFIREVFGPDYLSAESKETLGPTKTPLTLSIADGLTFEFGPSEKIHVRLTNSVGLVQIEEIKPTFSWWSEISPIAKVHAWVGPAVHVIVGIFRFVVGNSLKATAAAAGAGAVGGCVVGTKTKYDYETLDKACSSGALDGALIVGGLASLPFVSKRIDSALAKGAAPTTAAKYIRGLGLLGAVAAISFSIPTLATMNGSNLRCHGANGDFILSAQVEGATRHTLYESIGDRLQFYKSKEPGPRTAANEKEFVSFLAGNELFKGLPPDQLKILAQQLLLEREKNREVCRKHGNGYTESRAFGTERRFVEELEGARPRHSPSTK